MTPPLQSPPSTLLTPHCVLSPPEGLVHPARGFPGSALPHPPEEEPVGSAPTPNPPHPEGLSGARAPTASPLRTGREPHAQRAPGWAAPGWAGEGPGAETPPQQRLLVVPSHRANRKPKATRAVGPRCHS